MNLFKNKEKVLNEYLKKNFDWYMCSEINELILKVKKLNKELHNNKYNNNTLCLAIFKRIIELETQTQNKGFSRNLIYTLNGKLDIYKEITGIIREDNFYLKKFIEESLKTTKET